MIHNLDICILFKRNDLTAIGLRRSKQRDLDNALAQLLFTLTSPRNLARCGTLCEIQNLRPWKSVPCTSVSLTTPLKTISAMVSVFESGRLLVDDCLVRALTRQARLRHNYLYAVAVTKSHHLDFGALHHRSQTRHPFAIQTVAKSSTFRHR